MRVRFTHAFDYTPQEEQRVQLAYRPDGGPNKDGAYTVRRECGEAAIAAGAASEVDQDPLDHDGDGRKGGSLAKRRKSGDAEA